MKVRTVLLLDEEVKAVVQGYLKNTGMSMSSFVNTVFSEFANELRGIPSNLRKPVGDMTIRELSELMNTWVRKNMDMNDPPFD